VAAAGDRPHATDAPDRFAKFRVDDGSHAETAMRTSLKAALLLGLGAIQALAGAPEILAADLAVTAPKRAVVHHQRLTVVRDYDGTAIVLRRAPPMMVRGPDGVRIVRSHLYVAHPVERATPTRYLNGQPVRPTSRIVRRMG
jgi:hypothetical protein